MSQFDNVTVKTAANIYFDGKCVSHTVFTVNGERKTLGVIFPSKLSFSTGDPEMIEVTEGSCSVRLEGENERVRYGAGESFKVPGNSKFDIETTETLQYICHFG